MYYYENIAILDPSLGEEELSDATEKIISLITGNGGEIVKNENWGKKDLAYEIHKRTKGFYLFIVFMAPAEVIKKLEDYYKVFDPVFKFMVIKMSKKEIAALIKAKQTDEKKEEETAEEGAEVV
ncbi:30S ribosomal protein S6 [bacterium BMS3Bbin05]|nr:30S ribosomal protein S6 [bacterium BMS3Bbin05]